MNKTILCIEDDPIFAGVLKHHLEKIGCKTHTAENGELGLALASELRPDIILLDVNLPDIDGYQVCTKLKSDANTNDIKVLMLTGEDKMQSVWMGMETGADDYILKTKPLQEVFGFIDRWVESV